MNKQINLKVSLAFPPCSFLLQMGCTRVAVSTVVATPSCRIAVSWCFRSQAHVHLHGRGQPIGYWSSFGHAPVCPAPTSLNQ